jgi:hypothetical protein
MSDELKGEEQTEGRVPRKTRRDLLKTAGIVAGAAVAGKLATADSASAADGQALIVAANNSASNIETGLTTAGVDAPDDFKAFKVTAPNFDYALYGEAQEYGVWGQGAGGVLGTGTVGGVFSGFTVAINLDPQDDPGAPTTGEHFKGDLVVDANGVLHLCVADSAPPPNPYVPGTWIRVSHGGSRFLANPQRAYDSRPGNPPPTGPKTRLTVGNGSTATPRPIPIAGLFGIPSNALGIFGTLSIVAPDALIFASLWPSGPFPGTANILANPGAFISTAYSVGLNPADGTVLIGASGATDVIIDVAGYVL